MMAFSQKTKRLVNYLSTGLFILFAILQYNDPDPWLWIPIYGYAAWVCYRYGKGSRPQIAAIFGMVFCLAYSVLLFVQRDGVLDWARSHEAENLVQTMKATKPWIENTREFGGLLIVFAVLAFNYLASRNSKNA